METKKVIAEVPFLELKKAIVAINESQILATLDQETLKDIGVVGNRIKLVAVSRENMLSTFMTAFDMIEDDAEGKCPAPKEALDFYNKIIEIEERIKSEERVLTVEAPSGETLPVTKEKPLKVKKEKSEREKKSKGLSNIDLMKQLVAAKKTDKEISAAFKDRYPADSDEKFILKRISIYKNIASK